MGQFLKGRIFAPLCKFFPLRVDLDLDNFLAQGSLPRKSRKLHPFEKMAEQNTVELQCLEHLRDHGNMFEIRVVRASKCLS